MGYVLIVVGLGVLGVAFVALIRGHVGWARIASRKTAVVVMMVGVVVLAVGGALTPRRPAGTAANGAASSARPAPSSVATRATTAPKTTANPSSKKRAAGGRSTAAAPGPAASRVWDSLARCESGGNWAINTGNGLYGGVQLDRATWLSYGGRVYAPLPSKAAREQQILIAEKVRADRGFSPWSSCARKLGLL